MLYFLHKKSIFIQLTFFRYISYTSNYFHHYYLMFINFQDYSSINVKFLRYDNGSLSHLTL